MRFLVTGATGFVGACLTRRLVETMSPIEVYIFTRGNSDKWRIADLLGRVQCHEVDLRDAGRVEKAVSRIKPAVIYHLAAYGGFAHQRDTPAILESNLMGTVNLLLACEKINFHCFVNTGSSSEYGIKPCPMSESHMLEPLGDYGVAKAAATLFCRSRAVEKRLPVITLRLFSPYGPWDDPKRLIPHVVGSLLRGVPPQLSRPESVRDFIYIDDVLDLYLTVTKSRLTPGAIINVGTGAQHSVAEVVGIISELTGSGAMPVWSREAARPEPEQWLADISKARTGLGWLPAYSLRSGLAKTVAWFEKNLNLYQ